MVCGVWKLTFRRLSGYVGKSGNTPRTGQHWQLSIRKLSYICKNPEHNSSTDHFVQKPSIIRIISWIDRSVIVSLLAMYYSFLLGCAWFRYRDLDSSWISSVSGGSSSCRHLLLRNSNLFVLQPHPGVGALGEPHDSRQAKIFLQCSMYGWSKYFLWLNKHLALHPLCKTERGHEQKY